MISQMSGPNARAARRPDGPSLKITPGWSAIRRPSSISRCASDEALEPVAARRRRRANSGASKRIESGVLMRYIVADALRSPGFRPAGAGMPGLQRHRQRWSGSTGPAELAGMWFFAGSGQPHRVVALLLALALGDARPRRPGRAARLAGKRPPGAGVPVRGIGEGAGREPVQARA